MIKTTINESREQIDRFTEVTVLMHCHLVNLHVSLLYQELNSSVYDRMMVLMDNVEEFVEVFEKLGENVHFQLMKVKMMKRSMLLLLLLIDE